MRSLRILLVDDDCSIGALLAEMISEMGHRVCSVETTQADAVKAALLARPDLMIVDVRLGSGSGITAMQTISGTVKIPHIFISGDGRVLDPRSSILLQKPFTQRDLVGAINQAMTANMDAL
jgi:DNA-binding response OmpR family regulator